MTTTPADGTAEELAAPAVLVIDEIDQRVQAARTEHEGHGGAIQPPLLVLGISERVGSNWLTDTLQPVLAANNEPLRQQISAQHPLSTLNPAMAALHDLHSADLDEAGQPGQPCEFSGLGQHWLAGFVASKYSSPRQLVKETNLYFGVPNLLRIFPDAPIVVLTRCPLGVASSFARGRLWQRWRYPDRYDQLAQLARRPGHQRWAAMLPRDSPSDLIGITRLVALGALITAAAVASRAYAHVPYEQHVLNPSGCMADLAPFLDIDPEQLTTLTATAPTRPAIGKSTAASSQRDDTFTTATPRPTLDAVLTAEQAQLVDDELAACLTRAADLVQAGLVDADTCARAQTWLAGAHLYRLTRSRSRRTIRRRPVCVPPVDPAYVTSHPPVRPTEPIDDPDPPPPSTDPRRPVEPVRPDPQWRNLLVTNVEFAELLNQLADLGLPNTHTGTHLLHIPMPHERGGRIHLHPATKQWTVSRGYEHHPAYWVTWIGAAAFAAWTGARLPTRAELHRHTLGAEPTNTMYAVGDVVAATEPGRSQLDIHHRVGNLQTWCGDGPPGGRHQPVARYLFGAAWNTPAGRTAITAIRSRQLLGGSRGIGLRPVRDTENRTLETAELAGGLWRWIHSLRDRAQPLQTLDQTVLDLLAPTAPACGRGGSAQADR
ncbi:hypothetical protein GCM10009765_03660 [Fodinicola feengrottensis]|uniref:Sulfatase-modifying factor enzyme-like domain-containing protein n=1 Tax=Fodinicola feengrottensis TaxID=435914 RepID=A0ABP4RM34_9ACTN